MERTAITVSDFLHLVNAALGTIPMDSMTVVGEIAEYRVSQGKWVNFDLKDEQEEAKISCFTTVFKVGVPLEAGMKIQVTGYPKVYERFGKFSLNVESVELVGEGALAKAYLMLKKKLEAEGFFDASRKRPIPRFPHRIGLITSSEAAAYGDFLRILNNRWGGVEVVHIPVHVQGKNAVPEILQAFELFNEMSEKPDVIVLTRGGGSLEDLHAFNDELVARAVFQSTIPVVCGVGHERDESLCDFVADVRASTPSNAAEIVVPDRRDLQREILSSIRRMGDILKHDADRREHVVNHSIGVFDRFVERRRYDVQRLENENRVSFENLFSFAKSSATSTIRLFESFNIQKTLDRGYSIVRSDGKILKEASTLVLGDALEIQFARSKIDATVGKTRQQKLL